MIQSTELIQKVNNIYNWLENQLKEHSDLAGVCKLCGKCCDFDSYDHRLFVTPPEIEYLIAKIGRDNIKPMTTSRCPHNIDSRCTIHQNRFAACRIFCCQGDKDLQSRLSEEVLRKLKSLCDEFEIPYRYVDLPTVLNNHGA